MKNNAIAAAPEDIVLTSNVARRIVILGTASFKGNSTWKVKFGEFGGSSSVLASISDAVSLAAIDNGTERFDKGDVLFVELKTTQTLSHGKIIDSYEIQKVLEHKTSIDQLSLS